ncbi:hypothetical protein K523DRAFT_325836 [Schizophyllum commune Tattone D]|nr:hypothetical protein K523DRAFT_325836 [Schizophyllum commune Tattone D]
MGDRSTCVRNERISRAVDHDLSRRPLRTYQYYPSSNFEDLRREPLMPGDAGGLDPRS